MGRHWVEQFNGGKLAARRDERGWTQNKVAEMVPTSREAISNYENGQRKPQLRVLRAIAEGFAVKISAFLDPIDDDKAEMADLRDRQGLLQHEVADRMGMNHVTYQRIEKGRARIDADHLAELARILNTSTTVLAKKLKVRPRP